MTQNDGGPAFPVSTSNETNGHQDGPNTWQFPGMSLRDYFAAAAMQGTGAQPESGSWPAEGIAKAAYQQADAMLKAREQTS